jgi:hypothetical protein
MGQITVTGKDGGVQTFDWASPQPPTIEEVEKLIAGGQGGYSFLEQLGGAANYAMDNKWEVAKGAWDAGKSMLSAPFEMGAIPLSAAGHAGLSAVGIPGESYGEQVENLPPGLLESAGKILTGPAGYAFPNVAKGLGKYAMNQLPYAPALLLGGGPKIAAKAMATFFAVTGIEAGSEQGQAAWANFEKEGLTPTTQDMIGQALGGSAMGAAGVAGLRQAFQKKRKPITPVVATPEEVTTPNQLVDEIEFTPPKVPIEKQIQERFDRELSKKGELSKKDPLPDLPEEFTGSETLSSKTPTPALPFFRGIIDRLTGNQVEKALKEFADSPDAAIITAWQRSVAWRIQQTLEASGLLVGQQGTRLRASKHELEYKARTYAYTRGVKVKYNPITIFAEMYRDATSLNTRQVDSHGRVSSTSGAKLPANYFEGVWATKEAFISDFIHRNIAVVLHEMVHVADHKTAHDMTGGGDRFAQLRSRFESVIKSDIYDRMVKDAHDLGIGEIFEEVRSVTRKVEPVGSKYLDRLFEGTEELPASGKGPRHVREGVPTPIEVGRGDDSAVLASKLPPEEKPLGGNRESLEMGEAPPTKKPPHVEREGPFSETSNSELEAQKQLFLGQVAKGHTEGGSADAISRIREEQAIRAAEALGGGVTQERALNIIDGVIAGRIDYTYKAIKEAALTLTGRAQKGPRTQRIINAVIADLETRGKKIGGNPEEGSISLQAITAPIRAVGSYGRALVTTPGETLRSTEQTMKTIDLASRASQLKTTLNNILYSKILSTQELVADVFKSGLGNKEAKSRMGARGKLWNILDKKSTIDLVSLFGDSLEALNPSLAGKLAKGGTSMEVGALQEITRQNLSKGNQERLWHLTGTGTKTGGNLTSTERVSQKLMMASLIHDRVSRVAQIYLHLKPFMDRVGVHSFEELKTLATQQKGNLDFESALQDAVSDSSNIALRRSYAAQAPTKWMKKGIEFLDRLPLAWIAMKYNNATFANGMMGLLESIPLLDKVPVAKFLNPRMEMAKEKPRLVKALLGAAKDLKVAEAKTDQTRLDVKAGTATRADLTSATITETSARKAHKELKGSLKEMRERGVVPTTELNNFMATSAMLFGAGLAYRDWKIKKDGGKDTGEDWFRPKVMDGRFDLRAAAGPFGWAMMLGDVVARKIHKSDKYESYPGFSNLAQEAEAASGSRFGGYTPSDLWNSINSTIQEGSFKAGVTKLSHEIGKGFTMGGPLMDLARQLAQNTRIEESIMRRGDLPQRGDTSVVSGFKRGLESNIPGARSEAAPAFSPFSGNLKGRAGVLLGRELAPLERFVEKHYKKVGDVTKFLVGPTGDKAYDADVYSVIRAEVPERILPIISDPAYTDDEKILFVQREMANIRDEATDFAKAQAMEDGRPLPEKVAGTIKETERRRRLREDGEDLFPKKRPESDYKMNKLEKEDLTGYVMEEAP